MSTQENDADKSQEKPEEHKWFEKSVEYQFVADAIHRQLFSMIIPLDGGEERIGDTVFLKGSKYVIVEFKETLSRLSGEYAKYQKCDGEEPADAFRRVANEFKQQATDREAPYYNGKHHFLVGGVLQTDPVSKAKKLGVEIVEYFSAANPLGKDRFTSVKIEDVTKRGIPKGEFDNYVDLLLKRKIDNSDDDSEGDKGDSGGVGNRARSIVIGIAGDAVSIVNLKRYTLELSLKKKNAYKP